MMLTHVNGFDVEAPFRDRERRLDAELRQMSRRKLVKLWIYYLGLWADARRTPSQQLVSDLIEVFMEIEWRWPADVAKTNRLKGWRS
jgi:hypothetical protein